MARIVSTPPIVDIDGSLWSLFTGENNVICIAVCDGTGPDGEPHDFDGQCHEGDLTLFLDEANVGRLLDQLRSALIDRGSPLSYCPCGCMAQVEPGSCCFCGPLDKPV